MKNELTKIQVHFSKSIKCSRGYGVDISRIKATLPDEKECGVPYHRGFIGKCLWCHFLLFVLKSLHTQFRLTRKHEFIVLNLTS